MAAAAYRDDERERAAIAGVAGIGLLQNAVMRFCEGNYLLGVDTTADSCSRE